MQQDIESAMSMCRSSCCKALLTIQPELEVGPWLRLNLHPGSVELLKCISHPLLPSMKVPSLCSLMRKKRRWTVQDSQASVAIMMANRKTGMDRHITMSRRRSGPIMQWRAWAGAADTTHMLGYFVVEAQTKTRGPTAFEWNTGIPVHIKVRLGMCLISAQWRTLRRGRGMWDRVIDPRYIFPTAEVIWPQMIKEMPSRLATTPSWTVPTRCQRLGMITRRHFRQKKPSWAPVSKGFTDVDRGSYPSLTPCIDGRASSLCLRDLVHKEPRQRTKREREVSRSKQRGSRNTLVLMATGSQHTPMQPLAMIDRTASPSTPMLYLSLSTRGASRSSLLKGKRSRTSSRVVTRVWRMTDLATRKVRTMGAFAQPREKQSQQRPLGRKVQDRERN